MKKDWIPLIAIVGIGVIAYFLLKDKFGVDTTSGGGGGNGGGGGYTPTPTPTPTPDISGGATLTFTTNPNIKPNLQAYNIATVKAVKAAGIPLTLGLVKQAQKLHSKDMMAFIKSRKG